MDSSVLINSRFPNMGTTIFTVMSQMANQHGALNLSQGFPDFDTPPELLKLVTKYLKSGMNQYAPMPGVPELRKQVALMVKERYSADYDWETEVTIVQGATLGLFCAISSCVSENDEVIVIEPAYDSYVPAIELSGAKPIFFQLKPPNFSVDWKELRRLVNFRTKAIIINSPHNPTGAVFTAQDMQQLEKMVTGTDIVIISDEVYEHIIFDGVEHQSVARFPKLASRSFIVSSFGKTYHATGWKTGYVIAPEKMMAEFRKIYQYVAFTAHSPTQYAIAEFMENSDWFSEIGKFYQHKRDHFRELLEKSRFRLYPCKGSYFQLLGFDKISSKKDNDFAVSLIKDPGIASIPISVFYRERTDNKILRFCFAKNEKTLEKAAEILCRI